MGIFNIEIFINAIGFGTEKDPRLIKNYGKYKMIIYKAVAEAILERSKQLCPIDTGHLRSTGHVALNSIGTYSVIYDASYALYVHEIIDNYHEFPTQAKFLEDAGYEILSIFGYLPFSFTMNYGDNGMVALDLDSISIEAFRSNLYKLNKNNELFKQMGLDALSMMFQDSEFAKPEEDITYDNG